MSYDPDSSSSSSQQNRSPGIDPQQALQQFVQQGSQQVFQKLAQDMTDVCKKRCLGRPAASLSSSEETCLNRCAERYFEAFGLVSKSAVAATSKMPQH